MELEPIIVYMLLLQSMILIGYEQYELERQEGV